MPKTLKESISKRMHIEQVVAVKQAAIEAFIAQQPKTIHIVMEDRPPAPR